jgi:hypothetical protein
MYYNTELVTRTRNPDFQFKEEIETDSVRILQEKIFITEVALKFFYYLNKAELKKCLLVDKTWKILAGEKLKQIDCFGDVGKEKPFPNYIIQSPWLLFPGMKVKGLISVRDLINALNKGRANKSNAVVGDEHVNPVTAKSHWMLITTDVISNSKNKSHSIQQDFIAQLPKQTKLNYKVPTVLDVINSILTKYTQGLEKAPT